MSRGPLGHLARRFAWSLSPRPPAARDTEWAVAWLLSGEAALWQQMTAPDRRHSIQVARRFTAARPAATRDEVAGALLHDVGKLASGLGTLARVIATVVGPRTARFRRYHDHELLGAELLAAAGSSPATVELTLGRGPAAAALRVADEI